MKPILFPPRANDFTTNGLGRLNDAITCKVTEELNGEYELEMTYPMTGRLFSSLRYSYIIVAKPFHGGAIQAFRIYKISKPMFGTITVYARHISYQLNYIPCVPFSGQTCNQVMSNIVESAVEPCPFEFRTDITGSRTMVSRNLFTDTTVECGKTDLVVNRSGLLTYSDHATTVYIKCEPSTRYEINKMLSSRFIITSFDTVPSFHQLGSSGKNTIVANTERTVEYVTADDAEYILVYLYNDGLDSASEEVILNSFEVKKISTYSWMLEEPKCIRKFLLGEDDNSIQAIYGGEYEWNNYIVMLWESRGTDRGVTIRYGKNLTDLTQEENIENTITGIYPIWKSEEIYVDLPEKILYSANHNQYPYERIVIQDFSSDFNDAPTVEELRDRAQVFMQDENIGIPEVSIEVKFVDLNDTMEYSGVGELQTVRLGDTVTVVFTELGITAKQKVTRIDFDVLNDRYELVTIGTMKNSIVKKLEDEMNEVSEKVTDDTAQKKIDRATGVLNAGRSGHIIMNRNEDGFANELYFLDNPNIAVAQTVLRINKNGIGFSSTGFRGPYTQAWTLDGHLTLGGINNASGTLEILDNEGKSIGSWSNEGVELNKGSIKGCSFETTNGEFKVIETDEKVEISWTGWFVDQCCMMSEEMGWDTNDGVNPASGTNAKAAINGGDESGSYSHDGVPGSAAFQKLWLDDQWYMGGSFEGDDDGDSNAQHLWDVTECFKWLDSKVKSLADRVSTLEHSHSDGGNGDGPGSGSGSGSGNNDQLPGDGNGPVGDDTHPGNEEGEKPIDNP